MCAQRGGGEESKPLALQENGCSEHPIHRQDGEGVPANNNLLLPSTALYRLHIDFKMYKLKHGSVFVSIRLWLYKYDKRGEKSQSRCNIDIPQGPGSWKVTVSNKMEVAKGMKKNDVQIKDRRLEAEKSKKFQF